MAVVSVFTGVGRSVVRVFGSVVGTVDGNRVSFVLFPV